jgi:DNA (cytosine-5)-methyltransferase 1
MTLRDTPGFPAAPTPESLELSSVELFTGAGGLALGLEMAGFRHRRLVELDPSACATLALNARNGVVSQTWDVVPTDAVDLPYDVYAGTALLAAGAPCQPFSLGGRQRGENDVRNLFPVVVRALREILPAAFLLENVPNLTGKTFRPYFDYIMLQLQMPTVQRDANEPWTAHKARLDRARVNSVDDVDEDRRRSYAVTWRTLNAADYGVPQIRRRVFIVGFRRDLGVSPDLPLFDAPSHAEDSLLWSQWITGSYWQEHGLPRPIAPPANYQRRVALLMELARRDRPPLGERWHTLRDAISGRVPGLSDSLRAAAPLPEPTVPWPGEHALHNRHGLISGARLYPGHSGNDLDRPAKTIKSGDHGNPGGEHVLVRSAEHGWTPIVVTGEPPRYLSVRECARVQTFPDWYHFAGSRTECMRQLGNAVPVLLARQLSAEIREKLVYDAEDLAPSYRQPALTP